MIHNQMLENYCTTFAMYYVKAKNFSRSQKINIIKAFPNALKLHSHLTIKHSSTSNCPTGNGTNDVNRSFSNLIQCSRIRIGHFI